MIDGKTKLNYKVSFYIRFSIAHAHAHVRSVCMWYDVDPNKRGLDADDLATS